MNNYGNIANLPYAHERTAWVGGSTPTEPVTLAEAKAHARVDTSDEDAWFGTAIAAAREFAEHTLNMEHGLAQATHRVSFDRFPESPRLGLKLPYGPASLIEVNYRTPQEAVVTLTGSQYAATKEWDGGPSYLRLANPNATRWPETAGYYGSVTVTYTGGWNPAMVPAGIKQAICQLVADAYRNREAAQMGVVFSGRVRHSVVQQLMQWHSGGVAVA